MAEIVRHLVDEVRLARAIDARVVEISLAQGAHFCRIEIGQDRRVARLVVMAVRPLELQGEALDIRQFMGALDLGMRGQDLLDQGRARSRQAENEDGIGIGYAPAPPRREKGVGAGRDLLRRIGFDGFGAITAFRFFQAVAAFVEGPGRGEVAAVLIGLAQRETEMIAVDEVGGRRRFLAVHDVHFRVGKAVHLQIGQAPIGVAEVRPRLRRAAIGRNRFRHAADGLQRMAEP